MKKKKYNLKTKGGNMTESLTIGKKRLEQLKKMPLIETSVRKSRDGNYIINKTTITSIKPVEYFMTVLESDPSREEVDEHEMVVEESKTEAEA